MTRANRLRSNRLKQSEAPLVSALSHCAHRTNAPFHTPGHKRGQGISTHHRQLFGDAAFRVDLTELPDLDNLFQPKSVILAAQRLAAEAFSAEQTWFLTNGSTCGIEAAILATCNPGDKIIVSRNVHSSVISGLILSGSIPIYVSPSYSYDWEIPIGIDPHMIEQAIIQHPEAKAVLIVSPTYHGACSDLEKIAHLTHAYNLPLIIDEAHAAHFIFHPQMPISALEAGADIAIQSAHKVLSTFTQAAFLHVQGNRIDRHRLNQCLQLTQSTSPSYLLLGSLDAARHQMATEGLDLMSQTLALADRAYKEISKFEGLRVLQPRTKTNHKVGHWQEEQIEGDRTRLTVDVSALGITGFKADDILHNQFSITAELPSLKHLTFIVSLGNTANDITQLIHGFEKLCQQHPPTLQNEKQSLKPLRQAKTLGPPSFLGSSIFHLSTSPRQAFFAPRQITSIHQAIGEICAETICPYPPGIPTLLPGELISTEAIAYLQQIIRAGGTLIGCTDPKLKTIQTVKSSSAQQ